MVINFIPALEKMVPRSKNGLETELWSFLVLQFSQKMFFYEKIEKKYVVQISLRIIILQTKLRGIKISTDSVISLLLDK